MTNIGKKMRELRESKLMSVSDLARRAGINPSTISKIEDGKSGNFRLSTLHKIAEGFGMTPEQFREAVGLSSVEAT